jgi:hypothetical protein
MFSDLAHQELLKSGARNYGAIRLVLKAPKMVPFVIAVVKQGCISVWGGL